MTFFNSYKRFNRLIQNESFEPMFSWGFRMALSGTLPVIWGLATGRIMDAVWITLTAEAVSWVEMKGSFTWRVRTLVSGAVLAVIFAILGTLTAESIWLSVICMFGVGFLATLLKNIGDRASGLALCVYMLFIICNAFPVSGSKELEHRFILMTVGAIWPVIAGILTSILTPAEQPYRRQIALIWRSISSLAEAISKSGIDKKNLKPGELFEKENEVRAAIDHSYEFYSRMAHQVDRKDQTQYQLSLVRKAAGLVTVNLTAIAEEMENIRIPELETAFQIKAGTLLGALNEAISRIAVYIISLKPEEKLIAVSHINRMKKLSVLLRQFPLPPGEKQTMAHNRILHLIGRTIKLLESAIQRIDLAGNDKPVFKSYSLIKTSFILKPKYLLRNIRSLFSFSTLTTHYALRSAIAASVALFASKYFNLDHGYWLPFSVMIVIQPYFGATYKKALDRVTGTVLGGIAGSLLLRLPAGLHFKEVFLFLTFILMVYYVKKKYTLATFIITLNLVLLFNLEAAFNNHIMIWRALCTIGGAGLAVFSGLVLFPAWDKKWLPAHLAGAIKSNYDYFTSTFLAKTRNVNWTRNKRTAETKNSNVFDSFNRYMEEPGKEKLTGFYDLITSNIRITRNLNNIHLEQDEKALGQEQSPTPAQQNKINECLNLFNNLNSHLMELDPGIEIKYLETSPQFLSPFLLNAAQVISLEKMIIELKTMIEEMKQLGFYKE